MTPVPRQGFARLSEDGLARVRARPGERAPCVVPVRRGAPPPRVLTAGPVPSRPGRAELWAIGVGNPFGASVRPARPTPPERFERLSEVGILRARGGALAPETARWFGPAAFVSVPRVVPPADVPSFCDEPPSRARPGGANAPRGGGRRWWHVVGPAILTFTAAVALFLLACLSLATVEES